MWILGLKGLMLLAQLENLFVLTTRRDFFQALLTLKPQELPASIFS